MKRVVLLCCVVLCCVVVKAQRIGNYVANGSFEEYYDCSSPFPVPYTIANAKNWLTNDSLTGGGARWLSACHGLVPKYNSLYQYPHSGQAHIFAVSYYPIPSQYQRGYPKNRLKGNLQASKTYCVKFYVNVTNASAYGIDGIGAYFGGNEIDTITKCNIPLNYITPQVQNPQGNIITDTLKWVAITGTFTANGAEKYLLLGNFLSNESTDTLMINPTNLPTIYTSVNIDDVSCIEVDLPAYAGRDTTILIGDSVYIGREPDFAIDTGCVWYKLPNTTTAIDTISGLWVKPNAVESYTYVVRQELECSAVKWDTVVVTVRDFDVGINELTMDKLQLTIYPNPANNVITIESNSASEELIISISDLTGRVITEQRVKTDNFVVNLNLSLMNGAYLLIISNGKHGSLTKKLLIAR